MASQSNALCTLEAPSKQPRAAHQVPESHVSHPLVRKFADYWRSLRGEQGVPFKSAFDPVIDAPRIVSNVLIYDVLDGGRDFRVRLIGDEVVSHFGRNIAGLKVSDYTPINPNLLIDLYSIPLQQGELAFYQGSYEREGRGFVIYDAAFGPLLSPSGSIDFLAGVVAYTS